MVINSRFLINRIAFSLLLVVNYSFTLSSFAQNSTILSKQSIHQNQAQQQILQRQQIQRQQHQALKEELKPNKEYNPPTPRVKYDFSYNPNEVGVKAYRKAFDRMLQMDSDPSLFTLKDAVFLNEDAFFNNTADYPQFNNIIDQIGEFLLEEIEKSGYDTSNNLAKNLMLYRFFTDTIQLPNGKYHLPFKYDFEDYMGDEDYSKHFVTKLLFENSGQCHSLPLLYLILAERIGAEAYLAISPNHTYVKFPLPNGGYQNIELTSNVMTSNAHILQSGYIKAEALQNKVYMNPLSQKELLSFTITDLINSYVWKYGFDPFVQEMLDKALELFPNNIVAHKLLSNYYTNRFLYVSDQIGLTANNYQSKLKQYPKAKELLKQRDAIYDQIDFLGYSPMPKEAYESWLQSMEEEKQKKDQKELLIKFDQSAR